MTAHVIRSLVGKTFAEVKQVDQDEIVFSLADGRVAAKFFYNPDCCARCDIEDISGDLRDLCDSPITMAEYVCSEERPHDSKVVDRCPKQWDHEADEGPCAKCKAYDDASMHVDESNTWTFVKLATARGYVTVRWFGSSNGYYSEQPSFQDVLAADKARAEARSDPAKNTAPAWSLDYDEHVRLLHNDTHWHQHSQEFPESNRKD